MKTCPSCSFLMGDEQDRCQKCAAEAQRFETLHPSPTGDAGIVMPDHGRVAVLTPPAVAPLPRTVRYRAPRKQMTLKMIVCALVAVVIAVAAWGVLGHGPFAPRFVQWGLIAQRTEAFPANWRTVTDPSGSFSVEMPDGADHVYASLDPDVPTSGLLVGEYVDPGTGSTMKAVFTDFAFGEAGMAAYDSPAGVRELARAFIAAQMEGTPTVVRDAVVPEGYAVDTVVLANDTTARARFIFAGDRFYALVTTGPDPESKELDAAHQRLLTSFDPVS